MTGLRWIQMSDEELHDFLGRGGTGVISFSSETDGPPLSLPVSYGYDAGTSSFYFRLSFPPNSGKEDVLDKSPTFVVHRNTQMGWRSVIATGELEALTELPYHSTAIQGMWAVQIPAVDIFDRPRSEIEFLDFRLVPDRMTGRKEVEN